MCGRWGGVPACSEDHTLGFPPVLSFPIPQPFFSHVPPLFPPSLGHLSVNIYSLDCGPCPPTSCSWLLWSVTGCTRKEVVYRLPQTALEKNHLTWAFTMGRDDVSGILGLNRRLAWRGSCKGRTQQVLPAPPQMPAGAWGMQRWTCWTHNAVGGLQQCLYVCDNRNKIQCRSTKQFLLLPIHWVITNLRSLVISSSVLCTLAVAGGRVMASVFILGSHME